MTFEHHSACKFDPTEFEKRKTGTFMSAAEGWICHKDCRVLIHNKKHELMWTKYCPECGLLINW